MQFFSQTNPAWNKQLLGYNTDPAFNIGNYGCLITAYGNMLMAATGESQYNPPFINQWMRDNNGFLPGGGIFIWSKAAGLSGAVAKGTSADFNAVKSFLLPEPNFAILEVRAGRNQHFVLANTASTIADSEDGNVKKINTYPFVAAHLFTATSLPSANTHQITPINAVVTVNVDAVNARTWDQNAHPGGPTADGNCPVAATAHRGTIHVTGWVKGASVNVNGRTDDTWLRTDAGHWFTQAATTFTA